VFLAIMVSINKVPMIDNAFMVVVAVMVIVVKMFIVFKTDNLVKIAIVAFLQFGCLGNYKIHGNTFVFFVRSD
jgi:hypothetical protein